MTEAQIITVTAADFNGHDWDDNPFRPAPGPDWLVGALTERRIWPGTPNHTDYAEWYVKTPDGVQLAGPGDQIERRADGSLVVHKDNRP